VRQLRKTVAVTFLVLASVLFAEGPALAADSKSGGEVAAKAANAFAIDLYKAIPKPEGNIIFSPYSVSTALAMAYAGARGRTASQMAKTLHLNGEQDHVFTGFRTLAQECSVSRPAHDQRFR
jgi:serpin B